MADIRAFRAYRYDPGQTGALSDVVAPPYDVIDANQQQQLYDQSQYNAIRLILGKQESSDNDTDNRYTRTRRLLKEWLQENILVQDTAASLYVYHQEFEWEGQTHVRKGFLARTRLEPFGEGKIYPHEQTMPGPKADRLALMNATQMNLSPIFGMFPDEENQIQEHLEAAIRNRPPHEAKDHLGVINRLWAITDQQVISQVQGLMGPKPVFIADGHHRYETGLKYLEERRAAGEVANEESAPNFILMMLVGMSDPGLIIQPTHRLFSNFPDISAEQLRETLAPHFEVETIGQGDKAANDCWELMQADSSQEVLGFGTVKDNSWQLARIKDRDRMMQLASERSDTWRELAVSVLHILVVESLLKERFGQSPDCTYVHQLSEVLEHCKGGVTKFAALVPNAEMDHVRLIAEEQEKMPPKSTYFYPKLLSGLLFNSLKGN